MRKLNQTEQTTPSVKGLHTTNRCQSQTAAASLEVAHYGSSVHHDHALAPLALLFILTCVRFYRTCWLPLPPTLRENFHCVFVSIHAYMHAIYVHCVTIQ